MLLYGGDFAADVDAFMDVVGIDEATLVGHSGGTFIASRIALSYPRRVTRLVLVGSAIMGANNEAVLGLGEEVRTLNDAVPPEFVGEFQTSTIYRPVTEEVLTTEVSESLKLPEHVWRDYMEGLILAPDHEAGLGELEVPTLIVAGEQDALF